MDIYDESFRQQVKNLFDNDYDLDLEIHEDDGAYEVRVSQPYSYVSFKDKSYLMGMLALAQLFGCNDCDKSEYIGVEGCPTCGWGSEYVVRFGVWNSKGVEKY